MIGNLLKRSSWLVMHSNQLVNFLLLKSLLNHSTLNWKLEKFIHLWQDNNNFNLYNRLCKKILLLKALLSNNLLFWNNLDSLIIMDRTNFIYNIGSSKLNLKWTMQVNMVLPCLVGKRFWGKRIWTCNTLVWMRD